MADLEHIDSRGFSHPSAEFVSPGHPDKTADTISASVVQEHVSADPFAHVAAETMLTSNGVIHMAGEITSSHEVSDKAYEHIARKCLRGLGWTREFGYDPDSVVVIPEYHSQSPDIARGVENGRRRVGAGDQGITVGYAIRNGSLYPENDERMPLPVSLSRDTLRAIDGLRHTDPNYGVLKPDMKSEFVVSYDGKGEPVKVDKVVLALSHVPEVDSGRIRELVREPLSSVLDQYDIPFDDTNVTVNGTGRFVTAGAMGDTGMTGRKLVIDHYGPGVPIGGGAIHGKDHSKADAVGAMMGRWVANQVVGNGLADQCFVRMTWAIGQPEPLQVVIDTAGTENRPVSEIMEMLHQIDWSMGAAIDRFGGRRLAESGILFDRLAAWGPFGKVSDGSARPWETVVAPDKWNQWRA